MLIKNEIDEVSTYILFILSVKCGNKQIAKNATSTPDVNKLDALINLSQWSPDGLAK
ncbi:hypothetical protein GCM10022421_10210 [Oceanisphaera sediminis]|uniref:Uncharacterized protein n=1 Tax=Oceanisphaera sediminis TaxID=981381 RepID=A0ABP7DJF3_9GAMM